MKKVTISVRSKNFNITLEDDFVEFFDYEFKRVFKDKTLLDDEDLLRAFVQLAYERYKESVAQKELINKINSSTLSKD